jgi:ribose transport system ATP-binding protein
LRDVSLELRRGDILGLAGLMGSGRTETLRAIFGADPLEGGALYLGENAKPANIRSPADAVRAGMAFVTEDRKGQGLLLPATIRENISLASLGTRSAASPGWGLISRLREEATTTSLARQLGVRAASIEQRVSDLSGGNQQKVVMARWLMRDASILLLDEPTRGIDIGARFEIYQLLADLAGQGKALLVVSSELPELLLLCHRIAVLSKGKLVETFSEFDSDAILRAAFSEYAASARQ